MKKIFLILTCVCLLLSFVACDSGEDTSTEAPTEVSTETSAETPATDTEAPATDTEAPAADTEAPAADTEAPAADTEAPTEAPAEAPAGLNESEWEAKLSDEVFKNYTVVFEGQMSVTEDGQYDSTSDVWQKLKITSDKMEITARATEVGSPNDSGEFTLVFDGEVAETQKIQNSQLFLLILRDYDNYVYNAETNTYIIPETVIVEDVIKGIGGDNVLFDAAVRIEIREAIVTFAEDGMLSTLTCDYTQTMYMEQTVTTSGQTTWTFSDFGTTVIEE